MSAKTSTNSDVMLTGVRIAFPTLFSPRAVEGGSDPRYGGSFLFAPDSPNKAALKATIERVAADKWGAKAGAILKGLYAQDRLCLHSGDTKSEYEGFEGQLYVSASSKVRPLVIHRDRTPLSESDGVIYAGCVVNAKVNVWAQDNQYGKRINAQLLGVQFVRDDDAFTGAGRVAQSDEFEDMGGVEADDAEGLGDLVGDADIVF